MLEPLLSHIASLDTWVLLIILVVTIMALGKAADVLIDEAVHLSQRLRLPETIVGATIISVGTTVPEAVVSVMAAAAGKPGIALGNAVGSVICDTGLILGLASLIGPIPIARQIVNRQGWIQLGAGVLLVFACIPWSTPSAAFQSGGNLSQMMGFFFLFLLAAYIFASIRWSRDAIDDGIEDPGDSPGHIVLSFAKLAASLAVVVVTSEILIAVATELATRFSVPEAVIASTIVAFGTSLPELVTAVTAVRKGHGEIALGNIIGADILNVLFVTGAAAALTPGGLTAHPHFFTSLFPAMLGILVVFRIGIYFSKIKLGKIFGVALLSTYLFMTISSYLTSH